jgi:hypothetical protein
MSIKAKTFINIDKMDLEDFILDVEDALEDLHAKNYGSAKLILKDLKEDLEGHIPVIKGVKQKTKKKFKKAKDDISVMTETDSGGDSETESGSESDTMSEGTDSFILGTGKSKKVSKKAPKNSFKKAPKLAPVPKKPMTGISYTDDDDTEELVTQLNELIVPLKDTINGPFLAPKHSKIKTSKTSKSTKSIKKPKKQKPNKAKPVKLPKTADPQDDTIVL